MQPPVTASGDARSRVCVSLSVHEGFFRDKDHREGGSKILIRSDSRISSTNDLYIYIYIYMSSRIITISSSLLPRHFNLYKLVIFLIVL